MGVDVGDTGGRTLRSVVRSSIGGHGPRLRLSNAFGTDDLRVGAAGLALKQGDFSAVPSTSRPATFNGSTTVTVPAGAVVVSDPLTIEVQPLTDLLVSVFLTGPFNNGQLTGHDPAHQINAVSEPGDYTAADEMPVDRKVDASMVVVGIDVVAEDAGGLVAFGDSLTEGNLSTIGANHRWPDQLARRLRNETAAPVLGIANVGTGGGRLLHDGNGDSGSRRFDRDVLAQPGVTQVIVALGVNDLRNSRGRTEELVGTADLVAGYVQLARRAHDHGLKTLLATVMPWFQETFNGGHFSNRAEAVRQQVNNWIRSQQSYDGVIDFDEALRDPAEPFRLDSRWDSGDHLHPDDAGYRRMGDFVRLGLLR